MPPLPAIDYLGGAKYPELILKHHPVGFGAGFFLTTFGNAFPIIDDLATTGKCPLIRVHAVYTSNHQFDLKDRETAIHAGERLRKLSKKHPNVKFCLSPYCEHYLTGAQTRQLLRHFAQFALDLQIVNCGVWLPRYFNEIHLDIQGRKRNYFFSFDGMDMSQTNVKSYLQAHKGATAIFAWHAALNLKSSTEDHTPIADRKVRPTKETIDYLVGLVK